MKTRAEILMKIGILLNTRLQLVDAGDDPGIESVDTVLRTLSWVLEVEE